MDRLSDRIVTKEFQEIISVLCPTMDDYLYIYDIQSDFYCISPKALERFVIPATEFNNVLENFHKFVYEADKAVLGEDLRKVVSGEQSGHNLEYRWIDKDGMPVWINCRGQVLNDEHGKPKFLIGCVNEIGKKQIADNISNALGEASLEREIGEFTGERIRGFVLRLGIDNFKEINENRGIEYGDMILRKTAECIEGALIPGQKFYRIVADEFIVFDANPEHGDEDAIEIYRKVRNALEEFIEQNCYEVFYTISAGILTLDKVIDQHFGNIMKLSEFALNEAKNRGKNQHYVYEKDDYMGFLERRKLIKILRQAVNNKCEGFIAYFQPVVDIQNKCLIGAETLLRFKTEERGMISPVEFIPLLEESGLIIPVGKWVLEQAMQACSKIQQIIPDFKVSVNISYVQVLKGNVLEEILTGIQKYNLKPGSIMMELTESGFLESNANFIKFCEGLQENGISLALDDFGTGYSNFHYLYNLNADTIKIDRSFTMKALNNDYEYNLLKHMVDMSHSIELKFCVEGIETDLELAKISQINPDYIQGYYFGRPCPLDVFMEEYVNSDIKKLFGE
ncbi:MAG: GGDEF and EAL domain-containing protein [Lachnospiraceae bacterium]|nr:GGDEF and EAL domain-containing protein [Lachnospiraceae bacterium]